MVLRVPPYEGKGHIVTLLISGLSSDVELNYLPPSLSSLTPSIGPTRGSNVTIAGTGFGVLGPVGQLPHSRTTTLLVMMNARGTW